MGKRVLIARYQNFDASINRMLEKNGYNIVGEAHTGEECLRLYEAQEPDLVITDLHLADGRTGYGLADILLTRDPEARVIVLTKPAGVTADTVETAVRYGVCDFLILPMDEDKFIARVEKCLAEPVPARAKLLRVALVRGEKELQPGLRELLEACSCRVVLDTSSGEHLLREYGPIRPDMVLTALDLSGMMSGLGLLSALRDRDPAARVCVLTDKQTTDGDTLMDIMSRGACGFVGLPASAEGLLKALAAAWTCKQEPKPDAGKRVIVARRGLFGRKYVLDVLRKYRLEPLAEAKTGEKCVELYRKHKPDIVLVSTSLGGDLSALDVVRTIRADDPYARVIVYDGEQSTDAKVRLAAFERGACGYVVLPAEERKLVKLLGACSLAWAPEKR